MRQKSIPFLTAALLAMPALSRAEKILNIPMDARPDGSMSVESAEGSLLLQGNFAPENKPGVRGNALRFDGYTSFASGEISTPASLPAMSATLWVAPQTYPIVAHDRDTNDKILLAGTIDDTAHTGWGFLLGRNGNYSFEFYSGGWKVSLEASDRILPYRWSGLAATIDGATRTATLYHDGKKVAEAKCMNTIDTSASTLRLGKGEANVYEGPFLINTFNGCLDDLSVYDHVLSEEERAAFATDLTPDLSVSSSRFAHDRMRPRFHGMPGANWTNECHGLTYSDSRWHIFFQKNANGPYMSRLHWGHISSPDLCNWTEEKIAIFPDASYDTKGCWSGYVFTDPQLTGDRPAAIYTAVDYARAVIAKADPLDNSLIDWEKKGVIINGRPNGLSDDFRDPCFFSNGEKKFIMVGTSKNGLGATTLHRYNPTSGNWSNDGDICFSARSATEGKFWEMPTLNKIGDKWLFTATPLGCASGTRVLYWTGTLSDDGKFQPDAASASARQVEMISRDGYGLLSPSIYQADGKTIALGIVPDKLPGAENARLGWAHCYSLPREWSLDEKGNLLQRPYSGLEAMRSADSFLKTDFTTNADNISLGEINGRHAELIAEISTADSTTVGFNILKDASGSVTVSYNTSTGELLVDMTTLNRIINDNGVYTGLYKAMLPTTEVGAELKLNLFIDGSIMDIFVNDRWATSIRVFPYSEEADGIEFFATAPCKVKRVQGWRLEDRSGVSGITSDSGSRTSVYTLDGILIRENVAPEEAATGLPSGIYIIGGRTVII